MAGLILIVDDETDLVSTLEYNLEREGYETRTAFNGKDALEQARLSPVPDLVLLDLMLPDTSGIEVCKQLRADRETKNMAVLMLTARGEEIDRVVGFEVGADDYVVKPFSVRELTLRVRALLKRTQGAKETAQEQLCFGLLRVDLEGHNVWVDQKQIPLTALEFKLLTTLLTRKGRVQSRRQLLSDVWGIQADVATRTVDTHVKRLRQKLGAAGDYVQTLRGVGYRFSTTPDERPA